MTPDQHVLRKMRFHLNKVVTLQRIYQSVTGRKTCLFVANGILCLIDSERWEYLERHPSEGLNANDIERGGCVLASFHGGDWDGGDW